MKGAIDSTSIETRRGSPAALSRGENARAKQDRNDPMRRFIPTPYSAYLPVMGRTIQLETNSSKILRHVVELFARYPGAPSRDPAFHWRIVVESDVQVCPPWPRRSAFSDDGLRFAEFGQRNFVAVDIELREAIAFVSEGLAEDVLGFTSPFVDTLFYMTAGSLGLFPLASACVSLGTKGLLILGSANQGKTTASYLAAKDGLTYYSDQAVFLEMGSSGLHAWSDFVPPAFRPETLHFLPELVALTRRFSYCDFNFYYFTKQKPGPAQVDVVTPVCSVVLERACDSVARLVPLGQDERARLMSESVAFKDDGRFEEHRRTILGALVQLPAYRLSYGSNPAIAAPYFQRLLTAHDRGGQTSEVEAGTSSSGELRPAALPTGDSTSPPSMAVSRQEAANG